MPASRAATSSRLRATIPASTSAIADLDERLEPLMGRARGQSVERNRGALGEAVGLACGEQQGPGIDRHRLLLAARAVALEQGAQPLRIILGAAAAELGERRRRE